MIVNIIATHCKNNGIGKNNSLLWNNKSDLAKFKKLTTGNNNNAIIMGKNTFKSLNRENGLENRDNLILSKSLTIDKLHGKNIVKTFENINILENFVNLQNYDEIWVIGGEPIYKLFFDNYQKTENSIFNINEIYITYIDAPFKCDTYFPLLKEYKQTQELYFYSKSLVNIGNELNNYNIYDIRYKYI